MVDHLPLPAGRALVTRRARGNPIPPRIVPRAQHGAAISSRLEELGSRIDSTADDDIDFDMPVVLKMLASSRLDTGPLNRLKFTTLGEGDDWTYFVLSTRESRELLAALLTEYTELPDGPSLGNQWDRPQTWAFFVDRIDGLELYGPADRLDPSLSDLRFDPLAVVDCLLWPSPSAESARQRVEAVGAVVASHQTTNRRSRIVAVDPRPESTLVRIACSEDLLEQLLDQVHIERVRAPLKASITQEQLTHTSIPVNLPAPATTLIGVIDGIVNIANPLTGPYVQDSSEFPLGYTFAPADAHGTAVAGGAIWGDLDQLVSAGELAATPHPIVSARVLDRTPDGRYQVTGLAHVTIEDAVRWLAETHQVRIVNLSINQPYAADNALRDEITVTVDALARELDLVIVVSAGNRTDPNGRHWLTDYPDYLADPDARIASPGDAAIAVTVGSIARRDRPSGASATSKVAIAASSQPSPFTRCGPTRGIGKSGTLKPEFIHHGGNWSWDYDFDQVDSVNPGTASVVAIAPRGGRIVGSSAGTSYAAPCVAHEIARIAERYPEASANLLRALTALSARQPTPPAINRFNPLHAVGYGEPLADRVLESHAHRVFLTFDGAMETNHVVVHEVPIPAEFADGIRSRSLRVALAFDPPVRRGRREYIAGTMAVELVRGLDAESVARIYARQPTRRQAEQDPSRIRHPLPNADHRPPLVPGVTTVESTTLIKREFIDGPWDPDHQHYFLVVAHNQSAWTSAQRAQYSEQRYALALEIAEESPSDLDLYSAIRARLRGRGRGRLR